MADREDCTCRPPVFRPEDHLFRATFLARFESEEERQAVLILGRMLAEYLNETHQWSGRTDTIASKLEAVSAELAQIADYVALIGAERTEFALEADEDRLALLADRWSRELTALAETIRRELRPEDFPAEPVQ